MSYRIDQGRRSVRPGTRRRGWVSSLVTTGVAAVLAGVWACVPRGPVPAAGPSSSPPLVAVAAARPLVSPQAEPLRVEPALDRELKESVHAPEAPAAEAPAARAPAFRIAARHEMTSTMYCLKGRTRTGIRTRDGVAAADPEFLPLGSVVRLSHRDGRPLGVFVVMDTGGAVKGRKIDIYVDDCREAARWGVKRVTAEVLDLGRDAV